jgi:hypothetical protein
MSMQMKNWKRAVGRMSRGISPWIVATTMVALAGCGSSGSGAGSGVGGTGSGGGSGGNTVTATAANGAKVTGVAGGAGQTVAITFNSSVPVQSLSVTNLASLPAGWSAPGGGFACSSVASGNGCVLNLVFNPTAGSTGTLLLDYTYVDSSTGSKSGSFSIPYAATTHDNVVGTASTSGQVIAVIGGSQAVNITFTTDDNLAATGLTLTTALNSLPSGWSSTVTSFSCASISVGSGCKLSLTYAPTAASSGTLQLDFGYVDDAGSAQTATVSIPFASTTQNNIVGTVSLPGTISTSVGGTQAISVTFTTDDGNPASALTLTSSLNALTGGWSSTATSFSCPTVSTGSGCQLPLTFAPTAPTSGTLQLGYSYSDSSNTAKTGSVNIAYSATSLHLFVVNPSAGTISSCVIGSGGTVTGCASAGTGFASAGWLTFNGSNAYVSSSVNSSSAVYLCSVDNAGNLSGCTSAASGFSSVAGPLTINGSWLYVPAKNGFNGPWSCPIGALGVLGSCASTQATTIQNQAFDVAFHGGFAYVATAGDQSLPGVLVCAVTNAGALTSCTNAGSLLSSADNLIVLGDKMYLMRNDGSFHLCGFAIDGTLSNCSVFNPTVGSNSGTTFWGLAISNGIAFVTYRVQSSQFPYTSISGVASCVMANDGTFSACTDSGNSFSNTGGIAIH